MSDIETGRLVLRLLSAEALAATVARDHALLEALLGLAVPEEWFEESWVAELRLEQVRADPAYLPWSIRAIALRATGEIVGAINCHNRPMEFVALGEKSIAVELGYSIYGPWQRRGIAIETIRALTAWAGGLGVQGMVLSISPENEASLALARKLGAIKIGSHIDEKDGPEDVYFARFG